MRPPGLGMLVVALLVAGAGAAAAGVPGVGLIMLTMVLNQVSLDIKNSPTHCVLLLTNR